jgi:hypothetical protein
MKYRVFLFSFDYHLQEVFNTREDAIQAGIKTGFGFTVVEF